MLEGKVLFNLLRNLQTREDSLLTFTVDLFIMMHVLGVSLLWDRKVSLFSQLGMRLDQSRVPVGYNRVVELWDVDLVPSLTEDQV